MYTKVCLLQYNRSNGDDSSTADIGNYSSSVFIAVKHKNGLELFL